MYNYHLIHTIYFIYQHSYYLPYLYYQQKILNCRIGDLDENTIYGTLRPHVFIHEINLSIYLSQALDALWMKFLKRYLCLPSYANNATVLFLTKQEPFTKTLKNRAPNQLGGLTFPESLSGMKLSFIENAQLDTVEYDPIPMIPSTFWSTPVVENIPVNKFYRKKMMYDILDLYHSDICTNLKFHVRSEDNCVCKLCFTHAHPYHLKYCSM